MPRIIYIGAKNQHSPTGGMKQIYRSVDALARMGFDAYVTVGEGERRGDWIDCDVPILDGKVLNLKPGDHVVMGELEANYMRALTNSRATRHVYVQNHYYIFNGLREAPSWDAFGIRSVIASSSVIADFLTRYMRLTDVPVIPYGVDTQIFRPGAKKFQIAYMPRKREADAMFIRSLFTRQFPEFAAIPWVMLSGVSEQVVAERMAESAIFLSLSHREGFGLPPLEAMAANCLVVGFRGGGGDAYANDANGWWSSEDDLLGVAEQLADACRAAQVAERVVPRVAAGRATVERFSNAAMEAALKAFWERTLAN